MKTKTERDELRSLLADDRYTATPQTVLSLLDQIEELERRLEPTTGTVCPHIFCSDCARKALDDLKP